MNAPTTVASVKADMPRSMMLFILNDARKAVIEADRACVGSRDVKTADARQDAWRRWEHTVRLWNIWRGLQ